MKILHPGTISKNTIYFDLKQEKQSMYIKNEVYLPASIIEMNSIELELTSGEKYVCMIKKIAFNDNLTSC